MIVDLSFQEGSSDNNGIESDICSLHYAKVEEATEELVKQGHNFMDGKGRHKECLLDNISASLG